MGFPHCLVRVPHCQGNRPVKRNDARTPIVHLFQWIGFKGKSNQKTIELSHEIWGFPVDFPLNQSIDCLQTNKLFMLRKYHYIIRPSGKR
jgi:hypothetical protein